MLKLLTRAALAVLVAASLPAAAPAQAPAVAPIAYQSRTLANGLRVYSIRDPNSANVSVQVWYDVGSKDDPRGRCSIEIEETTFSLARYNAFVAEHRADIAAFQERQQAAFDAERRRWAAAGQADTAPVDASPEEPTALALADGEIAIESHVHGMVWQLSVAEGERVQAGQKLLVLEFMKTELTINAAAAGRVTRVLCREGAQVAAGQALLVITSSAA